MIPSSQSRSGQANAGALLDQALRHHHAGQLQNAAALYRQVLSLNKNQFDALHMLGVLEGQRGNLAESARLIAKAIKLNPKSADAYLNLGRVQGELEEFHDAEKNLRKSIALDAGNLLAYCNLSAVLDRLERPSEALETANRAIAISPKDVRAQFNKANALYSLLEFEQAEAIYRNILAIDPTNADAWLRLAKTQAKLNNASEAISSFERTAALSPSIIGLGQAFGQLLVDMHRYEEALKAFDQELLVQPKAAATWYSRGDTLARLKRHEEAIEAFETALRLDRTLSYASGARIGLKMAIYDWRNIEPELEMLIKSIRKNEPVVELLSAMRLEISSEDLFHFTRSCMKKRLANFQPVAAPAVKRSTDRIKVAYISSDFGNHPVAQLLAGVLEHHDRSKFEIVGFSTFRHAGATASRISNAVENFIDAAEIANMHATQMLRDMETHICVDLNGHSQGSRLPIFARRASPIQVNYLGYPGTSGTEFIDYIIADRVVVPPEQEKFYTEQVVLMPDSFMPADSAREISTKPMTRGDAGLPETGFVFCDFTDATKITPALFDIRMSLLRQIDDSVLWLRNVVPRGVENLRREAQTRGVNPDRLIFASSVESNAEHLARYRLADLFLDTLPYNAHATANEALWAGLPVLTCLGQTFAGRVAASQLNAVGLPELVTHTWAEYEALALKLARDPALLGTIRAKLQERAKTPLFDTARYTRQLEAAYTTMWERHISGQKPASFSVGA